MSLRNLFTGEAKTLEQVKKERSSSGSSSSSEAVTPRDNAVQRPSATKSSKPRKRKKSQDRTSTAEMRVAFSPSPSPETTPEKKPASNPASPQNHQATNQNLNQVVRPPMSLPSQSPSSSRWAASLPSKKMTLDVCAGDYEAQLHTSEIARTADGLANINSHIKYLILELTKEKSWWENWDTTSCFIFIFLLFIKPLVQSKIEAKEEKLGKLQEIYACKDLDLKQTKARESLSSEDSVVISGFFNTRTKSLFENILEKPDELASTYASHPDNPMEVSRERVKVSTMDF